MKEFDPSRGLHPRVTAEQEQSTFEGRYENCLFEAELWQLRMDDAIENEKSLEEIHTIAAAAVEYMDERWGYMDCTFFISGKWRIPKLRSVIDETDIISPIKGVMWQFEEEDVCEPRISQGWAYQQVDDKLRLGLIFRADSDECIQPYMNIRTESFGFAVPEKIAIDLITPPTSEQTEVHTERVCETIELYDKFVRLYFSQDNFFRQTRKKQLSVINSLVKNANEIITAPGTGLYIQSTISEFYARAEASSPYGYEYMSILATTGQTHAELRGVLRGVAVLEQSVLEEPNDRKNGFKSDFEKALFTPRPIRNKSDFIDENAGLCLLVTIYNDDGTSADMYVPYRATELTTENLTAYNGT